MKKMKERIEAKKEARMEELREELRQEKETKKETEEMNNEENKINESPIEDNEAKEAKIEETENKEAETEASENEEKEEMVENGVHNYSAEESYVWPTDPKVRKKLEWFRDQKLGLMMHWGAYSQLGIVESWALSDADACWSRHCIDWEVTGEEFKKQYFETRLLIQSVLSQKNGPISQRQPEPNICCLRQSIMTVSVCGIASIPITRLLHRIVRITPITMPISVHTCLNPSASVTLA